MQQNHKTVANKLTESTE